MREDPCYRNLLKNEIARRARKNRNYSNRAFARDVGLSPGYLSQVLSGRRKLSEEKATKIAEKLNWSMPQTLWLLNLVRLDSAKTESHKDAIRKMLPNTRVQTFRDLSHETFNFMAHWYYSAILALIDTEGFKPDAKWIGKKLSLAATTAASALESLKNLGLIREDKGTLKTQFDMLRVLSIPSAAIREHHRQFLRKAEVALDTQGPDVRDITGTTIAINPEKIPEAKALIKRFREEVSALLDEGDVKSQVYRLSVQLFRLDT